MLIAVILAVLCVAGTIDYLLRITDRGSRVLLSIVVLTSVVASASWIGRRWRRRNWSDLKAAEFIQHSFPQLGDRLASSLEFLRQEEHDKTAGSARLRRAVVAETAATVETLPVGDVATSQSIRKSYHALAAAAMVAAGFALAAPQAAQTALGRLVAPWNNVEWPRSNNLVFEKAPQLVARRSNFEASLIDSAGDLPGEVKIEFRERLNGKLRLERAAMQRVGDRAVARRSNVQRSFEYRATGGDHHTMPWNKVEVVDPPQIEQFALTAHPPKYSGLPDATLQPSQRILSGTQVELRGKSTSSLSNAKLESTNANAGEVLSVEASVTGDEQESVQIPADQLLLESAKGQATHVLDMQLTAENGLMASARLGELVVVADKKPSFTWVEPSENLDVIGTAVLPLEATCSDDLALRRVDILLGLANGEKLTNANQEKRNLYDAGDIPPERQAVPGRDELFDSQTLTGVIDIALLELPVGTTLELKADAMDFASQHSAGTAIRRVTIISPDELDSQLAADQAEILRLLELALSDQRTAKAKTDELAELASAGSTVTQSDLDKLVSSRLAQQNTRRTLTAVSEGVSDRVASLLGRLNVNRLQRPALTSQLEHIRSQVASLAKQPLPIAEQRMTDLRKEFGSRLGEPANQQQAAQTVNTTQQLATAQLQVVDTLEALIDRAGEWSDSDRFIRELARLEQEQRKLRESTLAAARKQLTARANRAGEGIAPKEIERIEAAQADLARRFEKLAATMRQSANNSNTADPESDALARRLADALAEAERSNLAGLMTEGRRQVGQQQLGRATGSQQAAADKLRELVELLRDRAPSDPAELASQLRELQRQLNQLATAAQQAKSPVERDRLADQLQQLARKLDRMTAPAAGESTKQAAESAASKPGQSAASAEESMQQAQKQIKQAQRQLADRIAELQQQTQQRLLDRLVQVLTDLVPRQQLLLEQTLEIEYQREADPEANPVAQLATNLSNTQQKISTELAGTISDLARRAVFQLALQTAADDMQQASAALAASDTGRVTQALQLGALARMRHVLEVLTAPPPQPDEDEQQEGQGGGQQQQQPPLIELAEVKMLRWLQADLNGRTRLYEADLADDQALAEAKRQASERLSDEQQSLTELVREMLERNNSNMQPEVDL